MSYYLQDLSKLIRYSLCRHNDYYAEYLQQLPELYLGSCQLCWNFFTKIVNDFLTIIAKKAPSRFDPNCISGRKWDKSSFINEHCTAGIYLFEVNNRNTRTRCEICSKLTTKTLVNFEHVSHLILLFLLLTLSR